MKRDALKRIANLFPLFLLALAALATRSTRAEVRGVTRERTAVYALPTNQLKPLGYLAKDAEVEVLGRTANAAFLQVQVEKKDGTKLLGYASTENFRVRRLAEVPVAVRDNDDTILDLPATQAPAMCRIARPWSFGAGAGGYSIDGKTVFTVSGDLRRQWCTWLETIFGVDLSFGDDPAVGLRVAQRFYAPISEKFRPYAHVGFRIQDLTEADTRALEVGGGFQIAYSRDAYFELGILYLWNTLFTKNGRNGVVFGGSSGMRF